MPNPLDGTGTPCLVVSNDQEARGRVKQVMCHNCRRCISTYRRPADCVYRHENPQTAVQGFSDVRIVTSAAKQPSVRFRQVVTLFVSLLSMPRCFGVLQASLAADSRQILRTYGAVGAGPIDAVCIGDW